MIKWKDVYKKVNHKEYCKILDIQEGAEIKSNLQNFLENRESGIELPTNCQISFHDLLQVIGLEMSHYREKQYGMINKPYCATFRDFDETQITYLFPKASCVNIAMQLYYMMWYKNNFSKEYNAIVKEAKL